MELALASNVQNTVRVPRANDRAVIKFFGELESRFGAAPCAIQISGANGNFTKADQSTLFEELIKSKSHSITESRANIGHQAIIFYRGVFVAGHNGQLMRENSTVWDTIEVRPPNQGTVEPNTIAAIIELVHKSFPATPASSVEEKLTASEALIVSHTNMVERLEQTLTEMAERHSADRVKLESEYDERRQKFNKEADDLRAKLYAELESERQAIGVQRQELEERARDIDDRQNTHVRRDIRRELKAQLGEYKKEFALTKGTTQLRWPIHAVVWALLLLAVGGVVLFVAQPQPSDGWAHLLYLAKPLGLTFVAVAIATWYVNWMNRWFERHADVEFRLKELELDIDRASWVVETAFEWKKGGQEAMPDKMLEAIGRNLFVGRDEVPAAGLNPVDQLASALLGQAANAKINIGGHQLEFDRKALRHAGRGD